MNTHGKRNSTSRGVTRREFLGISGTLGALALLLHGVSDLQERNNPFLVDDFPMRTEVSLQSSYKGKVSHLYTARLYPDDLKEEFSAIGNFFSAPVTVFSEDDFYSDHPKVESIRIDRVQHPWLRDLLLAANDGTIFTNALGYSQVQRDRNQQLSLTRQVQQILEHLVEEKAMSAYSTPLLFEGGQVLKTDRHTLIPDFFNDLRAIPFHPQRDYYSARDLLQNIFGEVILIPTMLEGKVLLGGHLDEFITILSPDTIAVGDVTLARGIISDVDPSAIRAYQEMLRDYAQNSRNHQFMQDLPVLHAQHFPFAEEVAKMCDATAQVLGRYYTVVRVPLLVTSSTSSDDQVSPKLFSYNNALVEFPGKIALPVYGIKELDDEAKAIMVKQGYKDILGVDSKEGIFTKGEVHCNYFELRAA